MVHSVFLVAAARPNFMKVAPLYAALNANKSVHTWLVHTGQHYDPSLSDVFFRDLGLPQPHISLDVGSGRHGAQTARVLERFEAEITKIQPALVIVVGDVNSTLGCALAAAKMVYAGGGRPLLAHVEAGLRSFDRSMPEEVNRVLTDAISDYLFITEESARENLLREGIPPERIFFVGNVMIDTLLQQAARARREAVWKSFEVPPRGYALVTIHRPSNVDDTDGLANVTQIVSDLSEKLPVIFPVHPRTTAKLQEFRLLDRLVSNRRVRLTGPLAYIEFLSLMSEARLVITDSGGVQEETTVLGVPCLTLRTNTERPVTVTQGTNTLVGTERHTVLKNVNDILMGRRRESRIPDLWDGAAAVRICKILTESLCRSQPAGGAPWDAMSQTQAAPFMAAETSVSGS
jgi:UDP-N-acetylglucosamine 2-epimerase (non-hydrolysing)